MAECERVLVNFQWIYWLKAQVWEVGQHDWNRQILPLVHTHTHAVWSETLRTAAPSSNRAVPSLILLPLALSSPRYEAFLVFKNPLKSNATGRTRWAPDPSGGRLWHGWGGFHGGGRKYQEAGGREAGGNTSAVEQAERWEEGGGARRWWQRVSGAKADSWVHPGQVFVSLTLKGQSWTHAISRSFLNPQLQSPILNSRRELT